MRTTALFVPGVRSNADRGRRVEPTRASAAAFGFMNAEYRFKCDEAMVAESLQRYRRSHPARMLRWAMKSFGFIGLGLLAAVGIVAKILPIRWVLVVYRSAAFPLVPRPSFG